MFINTFSRKISTYVLSLLALLWSGSSNATDYYLKSGTVNADYSLSSSDSLFLWGGFVNGTITGGSVQVRNADYNNFDGTNYTVFGTSSNRMSQLQLFNNLTLNNAAYVNNVEFVGSTSLNLNSGSSIKSVAIIFRDYSSGSKVNINTDDAVSGTIFGTGTVVIGAANTVDYDYSLTNFGKSYNALKSLVINSGSSLTLRNIAYITTTTNNGTLNFSDNSYLVGGINNLGTTNINNNKAISGTVYGSGSVVVGVENSVDYNYYSTNFGSSTDVLNALIINSGSSLTLSNDAYVTTTTNNGSLTLNSGSSVTGDIDNIGTLNLNTSDNISGNISNTGIINANASNALNRDFNNLGIINLNADDAVSGTIYGSGSVVVGGTNNVDYDYESTNFGNSSNVLDTLIINSGSSLTLSNDAYVTTTTNNGSLTLNSGSQFNDDINTVGTTNINANNTVNGTIYGSGSVVIGNSTDYDYDSTNFGSSSNVLNALIISSGSSLTLNNDAYVTTTTNNGSLTLNSGSSITGYLDNEGTIDIKTDSFINGTIYGSGSVVVGATAPAGYSSGSLSSYIVDYNYNSTKFGNSSNVLSALIINSGSSLTLNNQAYVTSTTNSGTLNLDSGSSVTGDIDNTGTINVNIDDAVDGTIYGSGKVVIGATNSVDYDYDLTHFGTSTSHIGSVDVDNTSGLTLNNTSYIDTINILSQSNDNYSSLSLKGDGTSSISLNTSGINYDSSENKGTIISLNGTGGTYGTQVYSLAQALNSSNGNTSIDYSNNNLYLDLVSNSSSVGTSYLIDSSSDANYFDNATITYEGIFKQFKLETEGDTSTGDTNLYLVVGSDRTPTTSQVSEATIAASSVIDNWTFANETYNEMILVSNLQNIDNNSDFYNALKDLTPDVSGLNKEMARKSMELSFNNIDRRLSNHRFNKLPYSVDFFRNYLLVDEATSEQQGKKVVKNTTKVITGQKTDFMDNSSAKDNFWFEGFFGNLKQDTTENVDGYKSNFNGFSLGYDNLLNKNLLLGVSYTLNQYDSESNDSASNKIKATTNNVNLYTMLYNGLSYASLTVGGSFNKYEQERAISFSDFNKTAKSDYNGYSYYGKTEFGLDLPMYKTDTTLITINPKVLASYGKIMIDNFKENGADAANLEVQTKDYDFLNVGTGVSFNINNIVNRKVLIRTVLDGYINDNLLNNRVELTAKYQDDTTSFNAYGFKPNNISYNTGVSFNLDLSKSLSAGIGYNYMYSKELTGQTVKLNVTWKF